MRSRDPIVAPTPTARSPSRFGQARVGRVRRPGARARAPRRRSGAPARHIPPSAHTPKPQSELTPCSHAFHVAAISRERRRCALRLAGPPLGGSGRGSRAGDAIGWGGRREADREHLQWLAAGGSTHCTPGPTVVSVWSASLSLQRTHLSELPTYLPQELQELGIGSTDVSELVLNARRAADARPPDGADDEPDDAE